jgi:hypothetical protein
MNEIPFNEIPLKMFKSSKDMLNKYNFYMDILMQVHEIYN